MTERATFCWYQKFWPLVNKWLSEMAAKNIKRVYITNYEFIPDEINKEALIDIFNEDSNSWKMILDEDLDLVCVAK